jgi:NADH-quinone oxidoreductase subunit C
VITVARDRIEDALRLLRDDHEYQQLMEIAGVDYPCRPSGSKWSTCCFR